MTSFFQETWYHSEKVRGKEVIDGRLRHRFYNARRLFIKVGLISRSRLVEELEEDEDLGKRFRFLQLQWHIEAGSQLLHYEFLFSDDDYDFDGDQDMLWLFNNAGPFLQLNEKWAVTAAPRKLLQRTLSINEFIKKFPCLRQQHGWEMVCIELVVTALLWLH